MTISVRESGMPMTVSRNSPSTDIRPPWTSRPNRTKNAVAAVRSATVMPTWSKRRTCVIPGILHRDRAGSARVAPHGGDRRSVRQGDLAVRAEAVPRVQRDVDRVARLEVGAHPVVVRQLQRVGEQL